MATVKFKLRKPKKDGKLKDVPVPINCLYNSKITGRFEIGTGEKVLPKNWTGSRVKPAERYYDRINKHLANIEEKLLDIWRDNKGASPEVLRGLVIQAIQGNAPSIEKKTVIQAVQQFIAQYEREKDPKTVGRYRVLLNKLKEFNPELTFEELDFNFYDAFKSFLYSQLNPNYTGYRTVYSEALGCYVVEPCKKGQENIGLFDDIVFKYFVQIKTICAWSEKRNYPVNKSYKGWEIIKRDYPPISLTIDELRRIEDIYFNFNNVFEDGEEKRLTKFWRIKGYGEESIFNRLKEIADERIKSYSIARDFLSLECRTGQRISDLRRFNRNDISGNIWTFTQKKGNRLNNKTINLPLVGYCAPALLILQKYNYDLPKLSEQKLNKHIKTICRIAGIDQDMYIERWAGNKKIRIPGKKFEFLSSHTGRKTFITLSLQMGIPAKVVMDMTGIKSYTTLRHYDGQSEIGTIEKWLKSIEDNSALMRKSG